MYLLLLWSCTLQAIAPKQQAVATAHPLATKVGIEILNQGGNAFDAAVAIAAVLGVVEPYNCGLGGGSFWLLHQAAKPTEQADIIIDAREKAPMSASAKKYLNAFGQVNKEKITQGPTAAGIPGQAAALVHIANQYGRLPLSKTFQEAIHLAEQGFLVDEKLALYLEYREKLLKKYPETKAVLFPNNQPLKQGAIFKQPDLAKTLTAIMNEGSAGFYQGVIADKIVSAVNQYGAEWTLDDLKQYQIKERIPLKAAIDGYQVVTMPPPSAGGITLIACLKILSQFETAQLSDADRIHLIAESLRRAYCDRANYLGDPDFIDIPTDWLISDGHIESLTQSINMMRATKSKSLDCHEMVMEGDHTTHFSVIDKEGNLVSATLTINHPFGSGFIVPGTGIILNNELDDFAIKPGKANAFELIGHAANIIAPARRPLSSMTPTFILSNDQVAILGTPGGSRIPSMVLLAALDMMDNKAVTDWVSRPRFHHQYKPDHISFEPAAFSRPLQNALKLRQHKLKNSGREYGNMQAILWDKRQNRLTAASDPRGIGEAVVSD